MRITFFLLFFCVCCQKYTPHGVPEAHAERILSNNDLGKIIQILETEEFRVYYRKQEIPRSVDKLLKEWHGEKVWFANKDEHYDVGCSVSGGKVPRRQIVMILKSEKYFIMIYNHGGLGHHQHILFSELRKEHVEKSIWIGYANQAFTSQEAIAEALKNIEKDHNANMVCF